MQERERVVLTSLIVLMLVLWLGFLVHRSPRFAGSLAGGVLGVSGALFMTTALAYALVKRVDAVKSVVTRKVPLRTLLAWHVYTGILGAILGLLHTGHKFESPLGILLTAMMLIVVFTGFVGRHLFNQVSQEIRDKRETLSKLQIQYDAAARELGQRPELALAFATPGLLTRLLAGFFLPTGAMASARGAAAAQAVRLAEAIADVEHSIKMHDVLKAAFTRWLKWHIGCSVLLYILLGIHIWSGLYYGLRWFHR